MCLKICVLILLIALFRAGQTYRFTVPDEINEDTVRMIQKVAINYYPQTAIDKYISVMRQQYSKIPQERSDANFEAVVLLVEGALYRTNTETNDQDVRSTLLRIDDDSIFDDNSTEEYSEKLIEQSIAKLVGFFPNEAVAKIASLFIRVKEADTLKEAKKVAFDATVLGLDGARAVTSRTQTISKEQAM